MNECVVDDHCWHVTAERRVMNPPLPWEFCCRCGAVRNGQRGAAVSADGRDRTGRWPVDSTHGPFYEQWPGHEQRTGAGRILSDEFDDD